MSKCLQSYDEFGRTVFVNVCTGDRNIIPWGIEGWLLFFFLIIVLAMITSIVIIMSSEFIFKK